MSPQAGNPVESYWQAWISSFGSLLSQLAAAEWQAEAVPIPGDFVAAVSLRITAEGGVAGQQRLCLAAADLNALLEIFLSEEVTVGEQLDDTQKEALEELIRQWAGLAATALKADFGEVRLQVAIEPRVRRIYGLSQLLRASHEARSIAAAMELDDALVGVLAQPVPASGPEAQPQPASEAAAEPAAKAAADAAPATGAEAPSRAVGGAAEAAAAAPATAPASSSPRVDELLRQGNLELLMDVELGVMLRFGSRQSTLHEVLDLATGAVLELDREIQEPVDLVLNGKVIARGEVVVVDGNYGLRVSEVASAQQRVNSL
jgi:flagellar motor switch protein FliN/FliY